MGNIPLAALLYGHGVSFAGVMAFIFFRFSGTAGAADQCRLLWLEDVPIHPAAVERTGGGFHHSPLRHGMAGCTTPDRWRTT